METKLEFNIEQLPEGLFQVTSPVLEGLLATGNTIAEAIEEAMKTAALLQPLKQSS